MFTSLYQKLRKLYARSYFSERTDDVRPTMSPHSLRRTHLSSVLPPLIFGTGTFNTQYNPDPYALDTVGLIRAALTHGIRAFDTSPYYGPSEKLLGAALDDPFNRENFPRDQYFILTKAGRIAANEFDYSPSWIRQSVRRSLERLRTEYLDVVYLHDVEFVTVDEVLGAVEELRRLRDEDGCLRYVGVAGYPVDVLCSIAERVLEETGEPLDIVQSYANYTLQNTLLATRGVSRLKAAGVDVVTNASLLGMGLLRGDGLPANGEGDWHPAPSGLRQAVEDASEYCERHGERIEEVATRYALESWLEVGSPVGTRGHHIPGTSRSLQSNADWGQRTLGVGVIGVSRAEELEQAVKIWQSILNGVEGGEHTSEDDYKLSLSRKETILSLTEGVRQVFGDWIDYAWDSPPAGFVNRRPVAEKRKDGES